jgi:RND family efflux transporter MFP subunit
MSIASPPELRSVVRRRRKIRWRWVILPLAAAAVVAAVLVGAGYFHGEESHVVTGSFYTIIPTDMDITVSKDGDLQAVNNIDIMNLVEGSSTITQIVDEGASVHKGDILIRLDSSDIRDKLEDKKLDVQQAQADLTSAQEMKQIQVSQNAADLEAAQVSLDLAKIALKEYVEGTYPQALTNAKTDEAAAEIDLKNKQETLSQTQTLFQKGFVTPTDVKTAEQNLVTSQNNLNKAQTALMVLTKYQHQMDLASSKSTLAQAEQKLSTTQRQTASNLAQKEADLLAKQQRLVIQKRRLDHDQEQLTDCTIRAPADGIVIYGTSGQRNVQNPIQEGAVVRQRQLLIRLPDTSRMKAVVMINEAQVPQLAVGQRARVKITGVAEPVWAQLTYISPVVDNSQRFWNPDLRQYPVDVTLDQTPPGLKPGSSAEAEIFISQLHDVVAVPLAAMYSSGPSNYVFVRQADGSVKATRVELGASNGTLIQITSGVKKDQQVLLLGAGQGRQLAEQAGIKPPAPASHGPGGKGHHREKAKEPKKA